MLDPVGGVVLLEWRMATRGSAGVAWNYLWRAWVDVVVGVRWWVSLAAGEVGPSAEAKDLN